jgi:serine phosphatase RsbU (regulator of sigma subunit)/ligand-binding sensor domain-containing protein
MKTGSDNGEIIFNLKAKRYLRIIYMLKKIFIILILVNCQQFLVAQEDYGSLVTFTEKDGIPSNTINSILQDHLGYIWIATDNGLLKYDGYKFHRIDLNTIGESNTYNPFIYSLFEDSEFNLWIGTIGGVVKYNRIEESFHFYDLYKMLYGPSQGLLIISAMDEDKNGTRWLGIRDVYGSTVEDGLLYLRKGEKQFRKFSAENDSAGIELVYEIEIDKENYLWFTGVDGLGKINLESMALEKIEFENSPIRSFNAAIHIDKNGILWGCEEGVGFGSYDPSNGNVKSYSFNSTNNNSLSNNIVLSIFEDKDGSLWLGTVNGINHFDPETEKFERYFYQQGSNWNYKDIGVIRFLIRDKSGSLWLGSEQNFLHKFNPSIKLFRSFKHDPNDSTSIGPGYIFSFEEDSDDNIWIGGLSSDDFNSGLSKYNTNTKTLTRIPMEKNSDSDITTIYQDSYGTIWIGAFPGLSTFTPVSNSFAKIIDDFPGVDEDVGINVILEDNFSNIWIGTTDGLFLLDRSNRKVEQINFIENGDSIPGSHSIQHLFESSKKELWIGTVNGLFKYNYNEKVTKSYHHDPNEANSLNSSNIGYIYEDREGILWLGTWLGGLNRFDPKSETFTHYTIEDGLPSNNIQGILEDEANNALWISSFEGISRFDLLTEEFRNFDVSHGVQGTQFARTSALETSKGEFFFGGRNGLNIFHPDDFVTNLSPPDILISDFKLFNKSVPVGDDSPLKKPIYQTEEIILASDENDISIDFLATHYVDPSHNEYAYMLENYENEWRYVGNLNFAIYPNLPPGEYVFRVKAANNLGVWNNEGKSLFITVLPLWWKTLWAYISYGFILVLGIFAVDRIQRKRILLKERNASAIKEAELRAKIAETENDRKTKELEEARQLQLSMLPKELPNLPNLDIAVYMKTATEVGGDYYDFSIKENGSINIGIGDATGHGMKAGTLVSMMKSLFVANSINKSLEDFFSSTNEALKNSKLDKMMMTFALLNINGNKIEISNAGIPPIFIYRKNNDSIEEVNLNGLPLGAMRNIEYDLYKSELIKGDTILMLSDGLPELTNGSNEMYGYDKTKTEFHSVGEKEPEEIVDHLKNSASQWVNGKDPDDDVTFVVIKVK